VQAQTPFFCWQVPRDAAGAHDGAFATGRCRFRAARGGNRLVPTLCNNRKGWGTRSIVGYALRGSEQRVGHPPLGPEPTITPKWRATTSYLRIARYLEVSGWSLSTAGVWALGTFGHEYLRCECIKHCRRRLPLGGLPQQWSPGRAAHT